MTLRSRIANALAEAEGFDINVTRYREKLEARAVDMISTWALAPREPADEVERLLEEGRLADVAREAERHANRTLIEERFAGQWQAAEPPPDDDHRTLTLRCEVSGRLYRVKLPVDCLQVIGHHEGEVALAAAGRRRVPRATSA